ncbi:MAG: hypothetical protein NUV59_03930 [Patescibacteria group bacterium]|nr:hypothetical protein [Patescibacteria group bacterium]
MTHNTTLQVASAAALAVIGFFLINPTHLWMPSMAHEAMLAGAAVVFGALAIFVFAEKRVDERDEVHRTTAGHAAFFTGGGILLIAIIAEGLYGMPDPWLVGALVAMVCAKVLTRLYVTHYR